MEKGCKINLHEVPETYKLTEAELEWWLPGTRGWWTGKL